MTKKSFSWQVALGILLVVLSAVVYLIHYFIFRDAHHIFIYLVGDIAFVFLEVLIVTLVIHKLLVHREKQSLLNKLNMVIGAFFSEVGTELLKHFSDFLVNPSKLESKLIITKEWSSKKFIQQYKHFKNFDFDVDSKKGDLAELRRLLIGKRQFLINLLENPNLLEHESFTDCLWTVFHITEELASREDLKKLPDTDYNHLSGDIKRAYKFLVCEWISYMRHLKTSYPYLFSLAIRTNPFDKNANVVVE